MKIFIPQNYFAALWGLMLKDEHKTLLSIKPASMINQIVETSDESDDLFLLPSLSLIKNKELFISKNFGIAFDGLLSNSYLYLRSDIQTFDSILLRGDVSMNEILLAKILFLEKYDSEIEIKLDTAAKSDKTKNDYLIVGNENLESDFVNTGISFADQIASMINFPYVEYVLASRSEESIVTFNESYPAMDELVEEDIDKLLKKMNMTEEITEFIKMNLDSLYFDLSNTEIDALGELLRLPFYHGITEEISELKLV